MTVAELIEVLRGWPLDARVVVDGYEGGFDDPVVVPRVAGRDRGPGFTGHYTGRFADLTVDAGGTPGEGPCRADSTVGAVPVVVVARERNADYEAATWDEVERQAIGWRGEP